MYTNIITKDFVDAEVRPFSGSDSLFSNCVREAIMFDLQGLPTAISDMLLDDSDNADLDELLDKDLRLAIAYFVYSRALRTSQVTVTKYGATVKNNQDSYSADNDKIVADSTYYKTSGEKILSNCIRKNKDLIAKLSGEDTTITKATNDNYLKCRVVGI